MNTVLLIISILPVIIIGIYIFLKDKNKEPFSILLKLFLGGISSAVIVLLVTSLVYVFFPSLKIENIINSNFILMFIRIFFGIAIIEEGSKWFMTYVISYNSKDFDEYYDIILYCVFIALGFACYENIIYVTQGGISTGILRLFTAVPAHCFFGVLMGEYLGLAKIDGLNGNLSSKRKNLILSIVLPSVLHCVYDFSAFLNSQHSIILFFTILIFGYLITIDKIKRISKSEGKLHK